MPKDSGSLKEKKKKLGFSNRHARDIFSAKKWKAAGTFAEDYRAYLSRAKTERESTRLLRELAESEDCVVLPGRVSAGKKTFVLPYRNKVIGVARLGKAPITEGLSIVAAHQDSPRLDLKGSPLYEEFGIGFFKTI